MPFHLNSSVSLNCFTNLFATTTSNNNNNDNNNNSNNNLFFIFLTNTN